MSRWFVLAATVAFAAPIAAAVAFVLIADDPASAAAPAVPPPAPAPAPALPVRAQPAVSFSGRTSQAKEISFELSADGRTIKGLHVTYRAECGGKGGLSFELADVFYTPVPVGPDGAFAVTGIGERLNFRGRIADGRASGTVRVSYQYGGMFDCTTPALRWTATG